MKKEIKDKIQQTLPAFVLDSLYADYTSDAIGKIIDGYVSEDEKMDIIKDMIGFIVLKEIKIESIKEKVENLVGVDDKAAAEITLIILREVLHPMKDFFPGIEDEIIKLGGEIPKEIPKKFDEQLLKREDQMELMQEYQEAKRQVESADMIIQRPIKDLIREYPIVEEQIIGSQNSIELKSLPVPMKPLVKYWITDYYEKIGYTAHSNMDRVQYVYHDKNTRSMNDEERRQLNLILKSLDEGIALPYSTRMKKIDFSRTVEE